MDKFNIYALYYDLLYSDKDYKGEVEYMENLFKKFANPYRKTILDLGCGTGVHANLFTENGYVVDGVDLSENMIALAKQNYASNEKLNFFIDNVAQFSSNKKYDIVTSLFHVMSYQNSNQDLLNSFKTAYDNLAPNGIFVFDFWYGPGVLSDLPEKRIKKLENQLIKVNRRATPVMHFNKNIVDVNYQIDVYDKESKKTRIIHETHTMRYLFKPEIDLCLEQIGFECLGFYEWMTFDLPTNRTWNAVLIAKKR